MGATSSDGITGAWQLADERPLLPGQQAFCLIQDLAQAGLIGRRQPIQRSNVLVTGKRYDSG